MKLRLLDMLALAADETPPIGISLTALSRMGRDREEGQDKARGEAT